jgi:hypothetical protein
VKAHVFVRKGMGMAILAVLITLTSLGLTGCEGESGPALSLHPFYLESDAETNPSLFGTWSSQEGDLSLRFEQDERMAIKLRIQETDGDHVSKAEFDVHLIRLGSTWFIDLYPRESDLGSTFYALHLLPAHSIARIELSHDSLELAFLDGYWLGKSFDAKTVDVSIQKTNDKILLTADTQDLQKLVDFYSSDSDAFPETVTLLRQESQE